MKVHLSKQEALPIIRDAYLAGNLLAQVAQTGTSCQYRGIEGTPCAIGTLIDDETALDWDGGEYDQYGTAQSSFSVGDLRDEGKLLIHQDEMAWFCSVQQEHDYWLQLGKPWNSEDDDHEANLRELLGL